MIEPSNLREPVAERAGTLLRQWCLRAGFAGCG
jgi:hypothetical protein